MLTELTTTEQVLDAVGGVNAAAALTGRTYGAAWNWLRSKTFPSDTFLVLNEALRERGKSAPPSLWGMVAHPLPRTPEPAEARG